MEETAVETRKVQLAQRVDFEPWLELAREVEPLFGPMVGDPVFQRALLRNIARGTAYCVRDGNALGSRLLAGLLLSPRPPVYRIGWLAVTETARRAGLGRLLVERALTAVPPASEIIVITFGPDVAGGGPARTFYQRLGFVPSESAAPGSNGTPRQVFRRPLSQTISGTQ